MESVLTPSTRTSLELLSDIRERLQAAHFAARGFPLRRRDEPVAEQLHRIRLLATELDAMLSRT
jgi:hypothetical protein